MNIFEGYCTVAEATERTQYTRAYVVRLIHKGSLQAVRVGNSWLVSIASIEAYLQARRKPGRPKKSS